MGPDPSTSGSTAVPVVLTIGSESRTINFTTAADTIYTTTFDPARKGTSVSLDTAKLTMKAIDTGGNAPFRVGTTGALATPNGYFEVTTTAPADLSRSYHLVMAGFANSSYPFTSSGTFGRSAGAWAASVGGSSGGAGYTYAGSGSVQTTPTRFQADPPWGATTGIFVDKATNQAFLRLSTGWWPSTPVLDANGNLTSGTGRPTGITEYILACGSASDAAATINVGATPFIYGPPTYAQPGWSIVTPAS